MGTKYRLEYATNFYDDEVPTGYVSVGEFDSMAAAKHQWVEEHTEHPYLVFRIVKYAVESVTDLPSGIDIGADYNG